MSGAYEQVFVLGKPQPDETTGLGYVRLVAIQRKSTKPVGVTNEAGEPEIVLDLGGLTLSMTPPKTKAERDRDDAEARARAADGGPATPATDGED